MEGRNLFKKKILGIFFKVGRKVQLPFTYLNIRKINGAHSLESSNCIRKVVTIVHAGFAT